jgi:hypothetical protein
LNPFFQRPVFWSIAGLFLLGFAGWEAVQLNSGGRKTFAGAHLPPPLRSRSGERPLLVRETQTGDPVANYLARAKRGMTEQEVRWMLEDFEAAGLSRPQDELEALDMTAAKAHRQKLEEWYLVALSEGLSLTSTQQEDAKKQLAVHFAFDLQRVAEREWQLRERTQDADVEPLSFIEGHLERAKARFRYHTVFSSSFAPWNLVQLTESQTSLTLRFWVIADWQRRGEKDPFWSPDRPEPEDWLCYKDEPKDPGAGPESQTIIQDPTTGNLLENSGPMAYREHALQSAVFAFTPEQIPAWNQAASLLAQAKCCHPAQLRMALLEEPRLFGWMRAELDGTAVQKSHSAISK